MTKTTEITETTQELASTIQESTREALDVSASSTPVSMPKPRFSSRRLGERLALGVLSAALLGLGCYYVAIIDLAFHYESKTQNQKPSKEEIMTDPLEDILEFDQALTPDWNESTTHLALVIPDSLNVRKEGYSTAIIIGSLYQGDQVTVLENDETASYVKIVFNNEEGYVHRDYLDFQ